MDVTYIANQLNALTAGWPRPLPSRGNTSCSAADRSDRTAAARSDEDVHDRSACICRAGSVRPQLFLEPIQLHFHLADLLVELGQKLILVLLLDRKSTRLNS